MTSNIASRSSQPAAGGASLAEAPSATKTNQCTAYHAADRRMVGPSLKEMAGRYSADELTTVLAKKVRQGGSGVWGAVPAPAMAGVDSQSVSQLASWISTYK